MFMFVCEKYSSKHTTASLCIYTLLCIYLNSEAKTLHTLYSSIVEQMFEVTVQNVTFYLRVFPELFYHLEMNALYVSIPSPN
jgi:hypothetical protein